MKAKLSEIWAWAAKELDQVRGDWGDPYGRIDADNDVGFVKGPRPTACALGAIEMFRSTKTRAIPDWDNWFRESYATAIEQFAAGMNSATGDWEHDRWLVADLNDGKELSVPWTFEQFSKKAKELEEAGVIT